MAILLLDHCVWRPTADALHEAGFRCVTLRELGRAEARNGEILALATQRRYVLITRDADFTESRLLASRRHAGIIFLRITPRTMDEVHRNLIAALRQIPTRRLRGALLIVEPTVYHLRRTLQ